MSYGKERPDPDAGGWEGLAEWTGGLPPEKIEALAAVRPFEAVHSLLRGLTGRNPRDLLARAAVLEAIASETGDEALSWLSEPARGETLRALQGSGWLEPGRGGALVLTALGRRMWSSLRYAASPRGAAASSLLPAGITPERIVRALLARSVEELAAAARDALVPVLPAPPLLNTETVAMSAEARALFGEPGGQSVEESEDDGDIADIGRPAPGLRGGRRHR